MRKKLLAGTILTLVAVGLLTIQATSVGAQYPPPAGSATALVVSDLEPTVGEDVSIAITVMDAAGAPVPDAECTFEIVSQPGNDASLDAESVTTNAEGVASTTLHVGAASGSIIVEGTCAELRKLITVVASAAEPPAAPPASIPDSLPPAGSGPQVLPENTNPYLMSLIIALVWGGIASLALVRRLRTTNHR